MASFVRARISIVAVLLRFRESRRGSAAVEFALIAPIFFGLLLSIIQVALVFFAGQTLETATQDSARMIMTGQAQTAKLTQSQFKNDLCSRIVALINCQGGVQIDVKSYSSFSNVVLDNPLDANNQLRSDFVYQPGNQGDIVVVRSFYKWPLFFITMPYFDISNPRGSGTSLMTATAAFRNEPFGSVQAGPGP